MRRIALVSVCLLAVGLAACTAERDVPTAAAGRTPGERAGAAGTDSGFAVRDVARLANPWAMTFLPGTEQLLITQKSGELLLRDQRTGGIVTVAGTPPVVDAGQGGFGDVIASPGFATDQTIYLSWVENGDGGTGAVIGRARLESAGATARLSGLTVIWRQEPKVSGSGHFSHRMTFSPDGRFLFVTSGDRQKFDPAQDTTNNLGSVLRLNPDGTAAEGNPLADRGGVSAQIWSYGHRNALGIAFDPAGNLWVSEMGPQGGDEINLVLPGRNYGWPKASNGSHYGGGEIPDHAPGDGFEAPKVWWTPSVSPGSLMIYSGDAFPQWRGDAFVGALSGQALIRVDLTGTDAVKSDQWEMGQRIREVEQGPDGTIWLLEDGDRGRLLQLTPG